MASCCDFWDCPVGVRGGLILGHLDLQSVLVRYMSCIGIKCTDDRI